MNYTDRNHESASLLSIPMSGANESSIAQPAQSMSAWQQSGRDAAGMITNESKSPYGQTIKNSDMPVKGSNLTSPSKERAPAISGDVSALSGVSNVTFNEDRLLDPELRSLSISNADACSKDK
jgi:hypothetical protein